MLLVVLGCGEGRGTLVSVHPHIAVCSTPDVRSTECGGPFDFADRPIKIASSIKLFVQDRGDGPLAVSAVSAKDAAIVPAEKMFRLVPGSSRALELTLTPSALGPQETQGSFA